MRTVATFGTRGWTPAAPASAPLAVAAAPEPTHHSDAVADGLGRQVAAELGPDHPAAAVGPGHLPPDHPGLVGLPTGRHRVPATTRVLFRCMLGGVVQDPPPSGCDGSRGSGRASASTSRRPQAVQVRHRCGTRSDLLLGLVDVGAALPQVEVHLVAGVAALHLQQRRVLPLVPQAALVAGKDGFGPQSGHR